MCRKTKSSEVNKMDTEKIEINEGDGADISESLEAEGEASGAEPQNAESGAQGEGALLAKHRECEDLRDQLLRHRAEFDNYRKRMSREAEQTRKTASENVVRGLLPVVDNLERALQHAEDPNGALAQGVGMVLKQLCDALSAQGLEPIVSVGEAFDPNIHEALAQQPSAEVPADCVVSEYERGYRLNGFVIRPAKVVISSGAADESAETGQ